MKFYVTSEPITRLRNMIANLGAFYIINVDQMLKDITLDTDIKSNRFIINNEIRRLILIASRSKRFIGVLYINSNLSEPAVEGIKGVVNNVKNRPYDEFILFDRYDTPKHPHMYPMFDEVMFLTTYKKTKIYDNRVVFTKQQ